MISTTTHRGLLRAASSNPKLRTALEAVPRFVDLEAAIGRCTAATDEAAGQLATRDRTAELVDQVAEALMAGSDVPATLGRDVVESRRAKDEGDAHLLVLKAAAVRVSQTFDDVVSAAGDAITRVLNSQLRQVVTDARALPLQGVADAAEAIARDRADAWKQLVQMQHGYVQLRAAQQALSIHDINSGYAITSPFATLRNVVDVWPTWFPAVKRFSSGEGWSSTVHLPQPWPEGDPAAELVWLVRNPGAEAWIPTQRQLGQAIKDATTAAKQQADDDPHGPRVKTATRRVLSAVGPVDEQSVTITP